MTKLSTGRLFIVTQGLLFLSQFFQLVHLYDPRLEAEQDGRMRESLVPALKGYTHSRCHRYGYKYRNSK